MAAVLRVAAAHADDGKIDFKSQVKPILAARCYECHGPGKRKGELRLSNRHDAFSPAATGVPVIEPGSSNLSIMIDLVTSPDPEKRMPKKGNALTAGEIDVLRRWIDQGAVWPDDADGALLPWSYKAPVRPTLPTVRDASWVRNPIDAFVLARLEQNALRPAPPADKATLLRRVSLDLTGLPPTPAELDAFVADQSPDAYEKVVDRLLASPRFGEQWARSWLDQARYGDSNGYSNDDMREAWLYRDWVIDAINADMPFDQFTVEQLAGDLLPDPTPAQLIATGFHRNSMLSLEAGINFEEARIEQVVDRVNTTATVWLAATFECARCHDHKYDPISLEEYYRLFAVFNNTPIEGELRDELPNYRYIGPRLTLGVQPRLAPQLARLKREQQTLAQADPSPEEIQNKKRAIADKARSGIGWRTLDVESFAAEGGESADRQADGSMLVKGPSPTRTTYTLHARGGGRVTAIRIEGLPDASLPAGGPGRNPDGGFVLNEVELWQLGPGGRQRIRLRDPVAVFKSDSPFRFAVDDDDTTGWTATGSSAGKTATAIALELASPVESDAALEIVLRQSAGRSSTIGRFRLSATGDDPGVLGIDDKTLDMLRADQRSERDERWLNTVAQTLLRNPAHVERTQRTWQKVSQIQGGQIYVMGELPEPRTTKVFLRGNHLTPGKEVQPGTPAALPPMRDDLPRNRLGLARWIVDPANPLTARVAVNRWWAELFGRGIVYTLEDFGTQSSAPTHPELLDWLARELMEKGWSRKHVVRLIVTSATYRQSSTTAHQPDGERVDPLDTLLWHGPRLRLPAETIRDQALSASGLLHEEIGGPPIYPPQPAGLWNHEGGLVEPPYRTDSDADRFRRGVYVVWRRGSPYPPFTIFDAPDRSACTVARSRTATPLQALVLLNDDASVETALGLAGRVLREAPNDDVAQRLRLAFRLVLVREPSNAEIETLAGYLQRESTRLAKDPVATQTMLESIDKTVPRPANRSPAEIAAWLQVSRVILNLDEVVTRG